MGSGGLGGGCVTPARCEVLKGQRRAVSQSRSNEDWQLMGNTNLTASTGLRFGEGDKDGQREDVILARTHGG